jgi:type VI secretion system FHA domain protein
VRPKGPGYLPPADAVRAGFRDIKVHELALLAGMRAALDAVLARFDPTELEGQLRKRSPMARLVPGSRKAKYWKIFVQEYRAIARDAEHSFRGAFGQAFADAYERQISKSDQQRVISRR